MPIRKFGAEPASLEIRSEDNDPETLKGLKDEASSPPEKIDRAVNDASSGERPRRD